MNEWAWCVGGIIKTGENRKIRKYKKKCPISTSSTTNFTWINTEFGQSLLGEGVALNKVNIHNTGCVLTCESLLLICVADIGACSSTLKVSLFFVISTNFNVLILVLFLQETELKNIMQCMDWSALVQDRRQDVVNTVTNPQIP